MNIYKDLYISRLAMYKITSSKEKIYELLENLLQTRYQEAIITDELKEFGQLVRNPASPYYSLVQNAAQVCIKRGWIKTIEELLENISIACTSPIKVIKTISEGKEKTVFIDYQRYTIDRFVQACLSVFDESIKQAA